MNETQQDVGVLEGLALGEAVAREVFGAARITHLYEIGDYGYECLNPEEPRLELWKRRRLDRVGVYRVVPNLHPSAPDAIVLVLEHMREQWRALPRSEQVYWQIEGDSDRWDVQVVHPLVNQPLVYESGSDLGEAVFRAALAWMRRPQGG